MSREPSLWPLSVPLSACVLAYSLIVSLTDSWRLCFAFFPFLLALALYKALTMASVADEPVLPTRRSRSIPLDDD